MDGGLRLQLSEEGADAERLASLAGFLRQELLELDVEDVTLPRTSDPAPGARAFDAAAAGALLVALGDAADGLSAVITAVSAWLRRGEGTQRRIRLEIGGDVLELGQATMADQDRLIGLFVGRHSTGEGSQWTASAKP